MTNKMMGNPAKLQDGVSIIMKVRPDALQGSRWGRENTSDVPDWIRLATWNTGIMTGISAEVVETLHRRKIDVCCT